MVITGNRQDMSGVNNLNHLEYMVSFDTNCTGARAVKRPTGV
jgi:hypothetical protein